MPAPAEFDVVVCEAIDRLSRKLADIAALYDQFPSTAFRIACHHIGLVTPMHVAIMGTVAQMYVADLRDKTRRGQLGRARAGRIPGGLAYGYDVVAPPPGVRKRENDGSDPTRRDGRSGSSAITRPAVARGDRAGFTLDGAHCPGGSAPRSTPPSVARSTAAPGSSTTPSMSAGCRGTAAATSRTRAPVSVWPGSTPPTVRTSVGCLNCGSSTMSCGSRSRHARGRPARDARRRRQRAEPGRIGGSSCSAAC